jgi:nicotinamidase-related amidase
MTVRTGLDALLAPARSVLLLIDHQPFQFANLHSHDPTLIINNVVGLAKAAKAFEVPTILTTVTEERGGHLLNGIQDVFPTQKPINRTFINTWEDQRVVEAVKKTGRKQLIIAARDWAREATIPAVAEITVAHGGASGVAFAWEQQLLSSGRK